MTLGSLYGLRRTTPRALFRELPHYYGRVRLSVPCIPRSAHARLPTLRLLPYGNDRKGQGTA